MMTAPAIGSGRLKYRPTSAELTPKGLLSGVVCPSCLAKRSRPIAARRPARRGGANTGADWAPPAAAVAGLKVGTASATMPTARGTSSPEGNGALADRRPRHPSPSTAPRAPSARCCAWRRSLGSERPPMFSSTPSQAIQALGAKGAPLVGGVVGAGSAGGRSWRESGRSAGWSAGPGPGPSFFGEVVCERRRLLWSNAPHLRVRLETPCARVAIGVLCGAWDGRDPGDNKWRAGARRANGACGSRAPASYTTFDAENAETCT